MVRPVPRHINEKETFDRLVAWIERKVREDKIPGIIIGVSGTDSLLSFLACHQAYQNLGKPERVLAVNFVHPGLKESLNKGFACAAGDKDWFAREIMPWLKEKAPGASFLTDDTIPLNDDNKRWGALFSLSLGDTPQNQGLAGGNRYVAGTRNRTEKALGIYSLLSRNPSLQPIEHLYKTEVLALCRHLGVPELALEKSREIDCDCGRFDVQAHHMDELDAFLMVEEGELAPEYLEKIDLETLTAIRSFYVEERANNAFREEIPYKPESTLVSLKGADRASALAAVRNNQSDVRALSHVLPTLIKDGDTQTNHAIFSSFTTCPASWRAEGFSLMGTPGLEHAQICDMAVSIFGPDSITLDEKTLRQLAQASARIGQYGFSFPAKRFIAQNFNGGPSLLERAGFERKSRPNDMRDPALPPANPARDELGIGFIWQNANLYVEQRRAYTLYSDFTPGRETTLLIRNSSYFFGRDRLPEPAYVSWEPFEAKRLESLNIDNITDPARLTPWHNSLTAHSPLSFAERIDRTNHALAVMDDIDLKFSAWLKSRNGILAFRSPHESLRDMFNTKSGGLTHLREFLRTALKSHIETEKPGSPLYLAQIAKGSAPWQPENAQPVTTDLLAALKTFQNGGRLRDKNLHTLFAPHPGTSRQLVLLSGPSGDFPVRLDI